MHIQANNKRMACEMLQQSLPKLRLSLRGRRIRYVRTAFVFMLLGMVYVFIALDCAGTYL
jgi:hypothetical protein